MGDVYLAEDPRIRQQVAIKVIRAEQSPYPDAPLAQTAARLFQREARAIVALDHARILPLHDYGEELQGKTSLIYLVMPYRPEGSLVDWVQQHYPDRLVPPGVVAHLVNQAAEALQHAHEHQVIHADVKPSNFLIRANPKMPDHPDLFLGDFGIARIATSTANTSQAIRGTPTYMAPEQCEGEAVPASDQYALAVMAYELLTGRPPFQGNTLRLMYHHVNTAPTPPSAHNPRLSSAVDEVLLTALAKRQEERFRSVMAFATAFSTAIQAMEQAEAATRVSNATLPKITDVLPVVTPGSDSLADASTLVTPQVIAEVPNPPARPSLPSVTPDWAAATAAPDTPPLLPTSDLIEQSSGPLTPAAPPGWAEGTSAPTTPSLPETSDFGAGDATGASDGKAGARGSGPATASVPVPSGPVAAGGRRRSGRRRFTLIAAAALVLLTLALGGIAAALPGIVSLLAMQATATAPAQASSASTTGPSASATGPSASATVHAPTATATIQPPPPGSALAIITPASQTVSNTFTISAVTGTPNAQQVQAHQLSATTGPYSQTVNATGQGTVPGTGSQATGEVFIVDMDTVNSYTFSAGTVYAQGYYPNGSGGPCNNPGPDPRNLSIHMVLDATVTLQPNGSERISAHILEVGTVGNIPQVFPNGCLGFSTFGPSGPTCDPTGGCWSLANDRTFTGGQDPQTYTAVAQSDIDNTANALEAANQPNAQQVLAGQVQPNERLVGAQCTPHVTSDHNAGDQATTVTVTVTFTCTGEVYDHDGALALAAMLLKNQAANNPGAGYALVGQIQTNLTNATPGGGGTVTLTVSADGVWAYQISVAQQQAMAQLIAGTTIQEAQQLLTSQTGVAQATVQVGGGNGQTLPLDPSKIRIVVLSVPGA
jgi:serine/threonine protein kinase